MKYQNKSIDKILNNLRKMDTIFISLGYCNVLMLILYFKLTNSTVTIQFFSCPPIFARFFAEKFPQRLDIQHQYALAFSSLFPQKITSNLVGRGKFKR